MTDAEGKGFAVALNTETLTELGAVVALALERIKAPETRGQLLWNVGRAVVRELLETQEEKANGPPDADAARETDRK